jgi:hypothetical protein
MFRVGGLSGCISGEGPTGFSAANEPARRECVATSVREAAHFMPPALCDFLVPRQIFTSEMQSVRAPRRQLGLERRVRRELRLLRLTVNIG